MSEHPPADWANLIAEELIAIVHHTPNLRYTDAEQLIAARLRELRREGVIAGAKEAEKVVREAFRQGTLHREYTADVAEYGADGWGGRQ